MRLFVSALLLAATFSAVTAVSAQEYVPPPSPAQAGAGVVEGGFVNDPATHQTVQFSADACPLKLTSAQLHWPAAYLPTSSAEKVAEPSLALGFQNASGRAIRSVAITAELKVKKDVYALDATPVAMRLHFAGTEDLSKTLDQLATIPLPQKMHSFGVVRVRLDQVTFADGGLWKAPAGANSCEVGSSGLLAAK
ncbi:MAG TPA: hypothetical protein VHZ09_01745 [Acidobacteriaceae bacterium]|jgi:hypothetical protein|nr:hypothetical protein [Acidobacteriaceae bacterium]